MNFLPQIDNLSIYNAFFFFRWLLKSSYLSHLCFVFLLVLTQYTNKLKEKKKKNIHSWFSHYCQGNKMIFMSNCMWSPPLVVNSTRRDQVISKVKLRAILTSKRQFKYIQRFPWVLYLCNFNFHVVCHWKRLEGFIGA